MTNLTQLRDEWGAVWVTRKSKTHIMPDCRYVTDKHHKVSTDAYPESHIDLCEWCEQRYEQWRDGVDTDASTCERCGEGINGEHDYCDSCFETIERRQARRV